MRHRVAVFLLLCGCAATSTTSPSEPAGGGSISVHITGASTTFPHAIALDGDLICGEIADEPAAARQCPGGVLGGQSKVTLTVNVEPGSHVITAYEKRQGSGSQFEDVEGTRLEWVASADRAYACDLDTESCDEERAPSAAESTPELQCYLNSDCDPGLQCISGRCVPLCREDRDCAAPKQCVESDAGYLDCIEP